jgi:hypothetical protein
MKWHERDFAVGTALSLPPTPATGTAIAQKEGPADCSTGPAVDERVGLLARQAT